ncbi:unnamed protein product [Ilex paraguariensis]|uniref:Uncharacterized protein n=1 Tax=Ilex paraguariensis TaxID=185542 RepID=A0ABC8V615_9AQUA
MRKFDPWPVFFRREWNRNWPFLVGFAITGTIITKLSLGLTEEDAKNSPFVQRHKRGRCEELALRPEAQEVRKVQALVLLKDFPKQGKNINSNGDITNHNV